ncbi:hypothetical protein G6F46_005251 [Rhizopus delemar]|uniref:RNA polymerase II degradation factor 1 n=3 Tax=Rhizopus TaxID=4842 RepID=I1BLN6_RHIO9|nr:hypothetical protein RO3G_01820 [Rhizopus delemar RA 99-880]KAG1455945.1 hypothetical protein G6F55_006778 [Rhizopus delemar]KAG1542552.1 hypothetical protein G6F51_007204 [Rhizopus arrhizus]KAG1496584.1 hypothetical protein G6F54_006365 [Rhizopus delemar]KAG1510312.1 hypothetical protein G6F53_006778 [Rhizopus delemar]|eukprot:EIE77116.1 hypothetical protein RO3G_01820 [Rhizopus delemar RA 99-880]
MTSYETRSTQNTRNKSSSFEQNDLKKLKSKHSSKLPTLKVLFSEWSDDDLLFVLEEANGDLDLAIDRISEGHANQWGEVKTKKSKKEAQKAKAAITTVSPHQQSSTITSYSPKPSTTPSSRTHHDRTKGKVPVTTSNRTRKINSGSSSWDNTNHKQQDSSASFGGSWASIARTNDTNDDVWDTPTANDQWTASSAPVQDNNDNSNDDQPKTWASLLKSKPKMEPENVDTNNNEPSVTQSKNNDWNTTNNEDSWNNSTAKEEAWNADSWNTATTEHPSVDEWSTLANESSTKITAKEKEPSREEIEPVNNKEEKATRQEEPITLPTSDISALDVKFSSLNVEEEHVQTLKKESKDSNTKEPVAEAPASAASNVVTGSDPNFVQPSYLKQQEAPASNATAAAAPPSAATYQHPQQQQLPQQVPQQQFPQQQQQQSFGMDQLSSAYSSYLLNQPHTGISGFGMNPMSNLPDYGTYGAEAQRAAAAMGYYDPTAFSHHSPATSPSPYQTREKYTAAGETTGTTTTQSQTVPQQMYPNNLHYYQYYYMPNQYSAYQQSAYGQPFMNKSMYPNMYQHTTTSTAAAGKPTSAAVAQSSPYGSPYGQQSQLYNQTMTSYDDLGISDYQKTMYGQQGQLQGFLGQQPSSGAQSTQPTQKSDISANHATATSQPTSGQQSSTQLPQQMQHPYANNFFGQPQMLSYQQYPQYQQQPAATNRQQYWNQ